MATDTVVCFDLDGTLVHFDRAYDRILAEAFDQHLSVTDDGHLDAYDEAFFAAFDALEADPYDTGVAALADHPDVEPELDHDELVATIREAEYAASFVPDAARACLAELAADDHTTLAVVTDGVGDWQRAKLDHHGLTEYFDEVIVSYDVGGHKTDGAPYDEIRDRLDADEYVMVGDDYESDVEGARAAGFVPIHYENDDDGPELFATLRAMM
ncbi:putative hydrolase of the HAD superfamily [Halomicrobium zhouii]|uniref:Putative hydrolase of the HAD superfamily n=1 Tax=Halomicrobium zhouii TaxID=767519 RepID=A0A1I6KEE3_9EURY|nr:HAD family hydrolase [Halomicrobium zhouii]SFR89593.1 putative hydrolase of the HAD superfamily [Halomicrobium zhouii]